MTELVKKTGLRPFALLRRGEAAFKELRLTAETPDAAVIRAMIEYPGLLQRPIVEVGVRAVVARPIEKALGIL